MPRLHGSLLLAALAALAAVISGSGATTLGAVGPAVPAAVPPMAADSVATPAGTPVDPTTVKVQLQPFATGLDRPDFITAAPNGDLWILEQHGRIRVVRDGVLLPRPVLDIASRVICCAEQGLLGLAFHPDYAKPGTAGFGRFYVVYSDRYTLDWVLAEFHREPGRSRVDPGTERRLMDLKKPYPYHFAGMLAFGPDGHLWIGVGDGGHPEGPTAPGDPLNLAQSLDTRLGKILRIDPLDPDGAGRKKYSVPADNPFVDAPGRDEIWAYGLRNPWRFSFDRLTGDLWIGDVGHSYREEIDLARAATGWRKGGNWGWRLLEGTRCYDPATDCDPQHVTLPPFYEYPHNYSGGGDFNCAVAGGYVVRDTSSLLYGRYVFGDYCSGRIWSLPSSKGEPAVAVQQRNTKALISSFGEGPDGELYLCDLRGTVYRVLTTLRPSATR